jgi:hypothetical protein
MMRTVGGSGRAAGIVFVAVPAIAFSAGSFTKGASPDASGSFFRTYSKSKISGDITSVRCIRQLARDDMQA